MAEDNEITASSEGLLGQIGRWGAALITDEELLEALFAHDAALRAEWEAGLVELARDVLARSKGRRWYAACWRDENGWLDSLESWATVRAAAEADVVRWRAQEEAEGGKPDRVVLASKLEYPWVPVPDTTGAES